MLGLAQAGCGFVIEQPSSGSSAPPRSAPPGNGESRGKVLDGRAATRAARPTASAARGWADERFAAQAVVDFATLYINWSAGSLDRQLTELAQASLGQARAEMELTAAQTRADAQLHAAGIENTGAVEAVSPLPGGEDQWVVVTQERTTASNSGAFDGLGPAWHVTIATVTRLASGRWVVSGWQAQS
jgi:hypothetical protein